MDIFGGYNWSFFIGSPEHMNYVSTLYDCAINQTLDDTYIDSEPLFKRFVDKKYTMKPTLNVGFHRVRYNGARKDH